MGSMDQYWFVSLVWPVLAMLLGALEICISVMVLKEGPGPKLMLAGAVAGLLGNLTSFAGSFLWERFGQEDNIITLYTVTWGFTAIGATLFTTGLLMFVLRRRALAARIAELEAILASQDRG